MHRTNNFQSTLKTRLAKAMLTSPDSRSKNSRSTSKENKRNRVEGKNKRNKSSGERAPSTNQENAVPVANQFSCLSPPQLPSRLALTDASNLKSEPFCASATQAQIRVTSSSMTPSRQVKHRSPESRIRKQLAIRKYHLVLLSKSFYALLSHATEARREEPININTRDRWQPASVQTLPPTNQPQVQEPKIYRTDPCTPADNNLSTVSFKELVSAVGGQLSVVSQHFQMAERFHATSLLLKALVAWKRHRYISVLKRKSRSQNTKARNHYQTRLLTQVFFAMLNCEATPSPRQQDIEEPTIIQQPLVAEQTRNEAVLVSPRSETPPQISNLDKRLVHQSHMSNFSNESYLKILSVSGGFETRMKRIVISVLKTQVGQSRAQGNKQRNRSLLLKSFKSIKAQLRQKQLAQAQSTLESRQSQRTKQKFLALWHHKQTQARSLKTFTRRRQLLTPFMRLKSLLRQKRATESAIENKRISLLFKYFAVLVRNMIKGKQLQFDAAQLRQRSLYKTQKRIFKLWFNSVDLSKRGKPKREVIPSSSQNEHISLAVWHQRTNASKLKAKTLLQFLGRFFTPWLRLTLQRCYERQQVVISQAHQLLRLAYGALLAHCRRQRAKKQRLMKLYSIRALGLSMLAFDGLRARWQAKLYCRALERMGAVFMAKRLQQKAIRAIKQNKALQKKFSSILKKHNFLLASNSLQTWALTARHHKKLTKFTHKTRCRLQHQSLMQLVGYWQRKKQLKTQIVQSKMVYKRRLVRKVIASLSDYCTELAEIDSKLAEAKKFAEASSLGKAMRSLCEYWSHSQWKVQMKSEGETQRQIKLKRLIWSGFQIYTEKRQCNKKLKQLAVEPILQRQMSLKADVFSFLAAYTFERTERRQLLRHFRQFKQAQTQSFTLTVLRLYSKASSAKKVRNLRAVQYREHALKKLAFQVVVGRALIGKRDKQSTRHVVQNIRAGGVFWRWFNLVHTQLPAQSRAERHYLQTRFYALARYVKSTVRERAQRRRLKQLQEDYGRARLAQMGLTWLYLHSQKQIVKRERMLFVERIQSSRLLNAWKDLTPILKAENQYERLIHEFRNKTIVLKCLEQLRGHAKRRIENRAKISHFRSQSHLRLQCLCIAGIINQNKECRQLMQRFVSILTSVHRQSKAKVMLRWVSFNTRCIKKEMSDQYFRTHHGFRVKSKCFRALLAAATVARQKHLKLDKAETHYGRRILLVALAKLTVYTGARRLLSNKGTTIKRLVQANTKTRVISALKDHQHLKEFLRSKQQTLKFSSDDRRKRIVLWCLLHNRQLHNIAKLVSIKASRLQKRTILTRWRNTLSFSAKITKMYEILQDQQQRKLVYSFLPNLLVTGESNILAQRVGQNERLRLMQVAFTSLRNLLTVKRMQKVVLKRLQTVSLSQLFSALLSATLQQRSYRDVIEKQIDHQNVQDAIESKRFCLQVLYQYRIHSFAKKTAYKMWSAKCITKSFKVLREYTLRRQQHQYKLAQWNEKQTRKFLQFWRSASFCLPRERAAEGIIEFSRANQVFHEWRRIVTQQKRAWLFRKLRYEKYLKFRALRAFKANVTVTHYHSFTVRQGSEKRDRALMLTAFRALLSGCQQSRLMSGLSIYHNHKIARRYLLALKQHTDEKNLRRLQLIKMRAALAQKPELKRPLLVLRNYTLSKCFQALQMRCSRQKELHQMEKYATYAAYLRLLRKSFYCLKLSAASRFQAHTSLKIKNLMIKKRWFNLLKQACVERRRDRALLLDATICRFLVLQRTALKSLLLHAAKSKKRRIQAHFAAQLYYKHLTQRVLMSLRIYQMARQEASRSYKRRNAAVDRGIVQSPRNPFRDVTNRILPPPERTNSVLVVRAGQDLINSQNGSISNEFVLSQAEMGPISVEDYIKMRNVPQTMLDSNKVESQGSSTIKGSHNRGSSALSSSIVLPLSSPSDLPLHN